MPATQPSTHIQRRAQPVARTHARQSQPRQSELAAVPEVQPEAPAAASSTPVLDNTLITRIVSQVIQAVVASLSHPHQPTTTSLLEPTTTREVALGGIPVVDATVQGPVASAMENLTGEHVNLGVAVHTFQACQISIPSVLLLMHRLALSLKQKSGQMSLLILGYC